MSTNTGNATNRSNDRGRGLFSYWRQDALASIVVFLVALPLCMGIALASGAPVATGLITGIVGGVVVGTLAGSPLQVSGPAAGLTVICGEIIRQNGMEGLGLAVLLGGVFQIIAGLLRVGQWFRAVSPAVIHGMLSGIGILIVSSQIHVLVDQLPRENAMKNIAAIPDSLARCVQASFWEDEPTRVARTSLLNRLRALSNRHTTLLRNLERASTGTQADLAAMASQDQSSGQTPTDRFASLIEVKNKLAADFTEFEQQLRSSPLGQQATPEISDLIVAVNSRFADLDDKLKIAATSAPERESIAQTTAQIRTSLITLQNWLMSPNWASKLGLVVVIVIVVWQAFAKGKLKLIPAPLLGIIVATLLAQLMIVPVVYVDVPNSLLEGVKLPSMTSIQELSARNILIAAITIAVIASAETLLCATAVDQMHNGPRTKYDQELAAQGIGNSLCGLLGALPMTGVIVRSAANVQAGGKTRLSAILHGFLLLLFTWALTPVLRMIPTSALAGILVYTGFRLIDFKGFRHLWHTSRPEAVIFLVTIIVIIVEDLLIGVVTGIVLSALRLLITFARLEIETRVKRNDEGVEVATMELHGACTFLKLPVLAAQLEKIPAGAELHVDLDQLDFIDHACLELFMNWEKQHQASGGKLIMDWESLHAMFRNGGQTGEASPS